MQTELTVSPRELHQRYQSEQALIELCWQQMREELVKLDLAEALQDEVPEFAKMEIRKDSFDGSESFYGEWRKDGSLIGSFIAHAGGNAFAEIDILQPHPQKTHYFIEAATAWGNLAKVSTELRLLEMP